MASRGLDAALNDKAVLTGWCSGGCLAQPGIYRLTLNVGGGITREW